MVTHTLKRTALASFLLSTATGITASPTWAMDSESIGIERYPSSAVISMKQELTNDTAFVKRAKFHIETAQENPAHIAKIQGELLPKTTGANTLYNLDTRPKVLNASEEVIEGESNLTLFNRAVEELKSSQLQLPHKYWEKYFIDTNKVDPQNDKINRAAKHKTPYLAARTHLLAQPDKVNVARFVKLVEGAYVIPDATKLTLPTFPTRNVKVYYTGSFSVDTMIWLNNQGFAVVQESFSDDHNIEGGPHDGVMRTQQEPFVYSNPELLAAATVVREARATLPGSRPAKNGQGVRMEFNEIHAYTEYEVQYDGKLNPVKPATDKLNILVEGASVDCTEEGAKPENHEVYNALVGQKRHNVMKSAAYVAEAKLSNAKRAYSTGLPGLGVFANEVKPTVNAMEEGLNAFGNYFDIIVFAGLNSLDSTKRTKAQELISQGQENATTENRILCGTYLMLEMLESKFGATTLPESF